MGKFFRSKKRKAYDKINRKHRKELIKLINGSHEWDWLWLHDSVIMQIRHMYEYYLSADFVWQTDETRITIVEQLQHVLELNEELKRAMDECDDNRERELYKEIYSYIGEHITYWWD